MNTELEKKKVPALRFPEFEGEWDYTVLQSVVDFLDSKRKPIKEGDRANMQGTYPYYGASGIIDYVNDYIFDDELILLGEDGANIITRSSPLAFRVSGKIWVNNHAHVLKVKKGFNIDFVTECLEKTRYDKFNTGTAQPKLNQEICLQIPIKYPTQPEQQKIADFLTAMDERIQKLSRKKELLEQYKKGVMQQIFSQQIRFKDDNGNNYPDWEEKRLDEIVGQFIVPMRDKPKQLDGEIPWCRIEDFDGMYLTRSKSNQGVSYNTVKEMNLKIYPVNTLLVSCSAYLGRCAIVKKELITNQTFIGLVPLVNKVNVEFLYYVMRLQEVKLNALSSGTTISYLSRAQFEKYKVLIPHLKEQQKIADYLSSIDNKIAVVNKELEQSQNFKKGLLQQMFV